MAFRTDRLDGELQPKGVLMVFMISKEMNHILNKLLQKYSSAQKLIRILGYVHKWRSKSLNPTVKNMLSVEILQLARMTWIKFAQQELVEDLEASVSKIGDESKIHGRYKRLAPFKDQEGIWRVGLRLREFTPFTRDHKPPAHQRIVG